MKVYVVYQDMDREGCLEPSMTVLKAAVRCHQCGGSVGERANPNSSHNYCSGCRRVR